MEIMRRVLECKRGKGWGYRSTQKERQRGGNQVVRWPPHLRVCVCVFLMSFARAVVLLLFRQQNHLPWCKRPSFFGREGERA
jgi:hypothetical protein